MSLKIICLSILLSGLLMGCKKNQGGSDVLNSSDGSTLPSQCEAWYSSGALKPGQCADWNHPLLSSQQSFGIFPLKRTHWADAGWFIIPLNDYGGLFGFKQFVNQWNQQPQGLMQGLAYGPMNNDSSYDAGTSYVIMQRDGNAVFYSSNSPNAKIIASSQSSSPDSPNYTLEMQEINDDSFSFESGSSNQSSGYFNEKFGRLKVLDAAGHTVWTNRQSKACAFAPRQPTTGSSGC